MTPKKISLVLVHPNAKLPTQSRVGDAGFDVYAVEDGVIEPMKVNVIDIGIRVANWMDTDALGQFNYFLKFEGRSGLASNGIFPVGGILDASYRGNLKVQLANIGETYHYKAGDRIAQLLVYQIYTKPDFSFEQVDAVVPTDRGDKGFGSSGK